MSEEIVLTAGRDWSHVVSVTLWRMSEGDRERFQRRRARHRRVMAKRRDKYRSGVRVHRGVTHLRTLYRRRSR